MAPQKVMATPSIARNDEAQYADAIIRAMPSVSMANVIILFVLVLYARGIWIRHC
jgi:hypothetical protein